ncbi:MAG: hypothetical protein H3C59_15530 [Burkholderiaceae bacterium]|nr:hypothetical protein [Burkholderiaceae bacterium]
MILHRIAGAHSVFGVLVLALGIVLLALRLLRLVPSMLHVLNWLRRHVLPVTARMLPGGKRGAGYDHCGCYGGDEGEEKSLACHCPVSE